MASPSPRLGDPDGHEHKACCHRSRTRTGVIDRLSLFGTMASMAIHWAMYRDTLVMGDVVEQELQAKVEHHQLAPETSMLLAARVVRHAEGYVRCHRAHPLVLAARYDGNGWGIDTGGETGATGAMSAQGKGWSLFDKRKAGGPGVWITDQGFGFWPGGRRLLTARGQDVAAARRSLRTRDHRRPSLISGLRSGVLRRSPRSCRTVREFVFEGSTDGCA